MRVQASQAQESDTERTTHTHHIPLLLVACLILKFVDSQVPSACKAVSLKGMQDRGENKIVERRTRQRQETASRTSCAALPKVD